MSEYLETRAQSAGALGQSGILLRLWSNWKARREVRDLALLDDHMLCDIGLTRADINWATHQPFGVNAALALEDRALEDRFK